MTTTESNKLTTVYARSFGASEDRWPDPGLIEFKEFADSQTVLQVFSKEIKFGGPRVFADIVKQGDTLVCRGLYSTRDADGRFIGPLIFEVKYYTT